MIFPTMWQIARRHPYLIPLLVIILVLAAIGHVLFFAQKLIGNGNCPDCRNGKTICFVACERVAKRLSAVDRELRR